MGCPLSLLDGKASARRLQCLVQIRDQVFGVFDTDGEADRVRRGAGGNLLFFGQLTVRGRGRVDDQRAGIPEVCDMAEQVQAPAPFGQIFGMRSL